MYPIITPIPIYTGGGGGSLPDPETDLSKVFAWLVIFFICITFVLLPVAIVLSFIFWEHFSLILGIGISGMLFAIFFLGLWLITDTFLYPAGIVPKRFKKRRRPNGNRKKT